MAIRIEAVGLRALPEMPPQQSPDIPLHQLRSVLRVWTEESPELHPIRATLRLPGGRAVEAEVCYRGDKIVINIPPEAESFAKLSETG